jgi:hypothetical protein
MIAVAVVAMLVAGCGGGSSGDSTTTAAGSPCQKAQATFNTTPAKNEAAVTAAYRAVARECGTTSRQFESDREALRLDKQVEANIRVEHAKDRLKAARAEVCGHTLAEAEQAGVAKTYEELCRG